MISGHREDIYRPYLSILETRGEATKVIIFQKRQVRMTTATISPFQISPFSMKGGQSFTQRSLQLSG